MRLIAQFFLGLIFGLGLLISGMTQPMKVQGFLDVTGDWDPSLALVIAGAIGVGFFLFRLADARGVSLLGAPIKRRALPIDKALVGGAAIFGIGWGLSGVCPGPAIVNFASLEPHAIAFVAAMIAGLALERFLARAVSGPQESVDAVAND